MAVIPKVSVYMRNKAAKNPEGMASKIACVGAFNSEETNPILTLGLNDAYEKLGGDVDTFKGNDCLEYLYIGASSVLCVNITTWTGSGAEKTASKELTVANLTAALAKIKGEDWDILFVADELTDEALTIVDNYLDETFEMKYPAGYVAGITRQNKAAYITTSEIVGEHSYGLIPGQSVVYKGTQLSVTNTGAYYAGLLAGLYVGSTMTMKQLPNVTSITPELSFETGGDGKAFVEAGFTVFKAQNRNTGTFVVVNSEQPNGYDLYINRVRDYIIKQMALHQFLGSRNREATLNEIKQEIDRIRYNCVEILDLLVDIEYTVERKNPTCVDINITRLIFDGIITTIDVYLTVEVE